MLESRRGQAPDNNDNSTSAAPALTADERMRLEKSQGYDRGRYVRVERGDTLTALTADQVEFGATIAYNRLRYPNHIKVGQDLFIPERGTYNEDAAKQVANAYWKAEEAAQEAARLQRIKAEGETQEGRWYQSGSSSPRPERTVQELRDYFNNMENSPGYQAVQYLRKNPGGSSFVKDVVDVVRPLNSGFGTVFTIAADYMGEKQAGLTGYNSVTHQFYDPDEQRDIRRSLALDAMLSAVPLARLGVANGVVGANSVGETVSLFRKMSATEADATLNTMKLQPPIPGSNSSKYLSESMSKVESFQNAGVKAGSQERTLEFILDKKGYDAMMNSAVNQVGSKGIDAVKYNFEGINSGSGLRNIGVPHSQLDLFNSLIKEIK